MLRIIGGKHRSRLIKTPEQGTVPTKNRVREACFSALAPYLNGAKVLDLFAGSGALGIEALSRGAKEAVFVDKNPAACVIIKDNLTSLKEAGEVINDDYLNALGRLSASRFDLVFLDPPYAEKSYYQTSIDYLLSHNMLSPSAGVVLEYEGELELDRSGFAKAKDYRYGYTRLLILREVKQQ